MTTGEKQADLCTAWNSTHIRDTQCDAGVGLRDEKLLELMDN